MTGVQTCALPIWSEEDRRGGKEEERQERTGFRRSLPGGEGRAHRSARLDDDGRRNKKLKVKG